MNIAQELFTVRVEAYENGHDDAFKSLIKGIEIMEKGGITTLTTEQIKDLIISCREVAKEVKVSRL